MNYDIGLLGYMTLAVISFIFVYYMAIKALNLLVAGKDDGRSPLDLLVEGLEGTRLITMFVSFSATTVTGIIWVNYFIADKEWVFLYKVVTYIVVIGLGGLFALFLAVVLLKGEQSLGYMAGKKGVKNKLKYVMFLVLIFSFMDFLTLVTGAKGAAATFAKHKTVELKSDVDNLYATIKSNNSARTDTQKRIKEINEALKDKQNIAIVEDAEVARLKGRIAMWKGYLSNAKSSKSKKRYKTNIGINERNLAQHLAELRVKEIERLRNERGQLFKRLDKLEKSIQSTQVYINKYKVKESSKIEKQANDKEITYIKWGLGIVIINFLLGFISGKLKDNNIEEEVEIEKVKDEPKEEVEIEFNSIEGVKVKPVKRIFTKEEQKEFVIQAMKEYADKNELSLHPYASTYDPSIFRRDDIRLLAKEIAQRPVKEGGAGAEMKIGSETVSKFIKNDDFVKTEISNYLRSKNGYNATV